MAQDVEWVKVRFNNSYKPGPKEFDFDINQISISEERDKAVDFSDGYDDYLADRRRALKQLVQSTLRKRRKLEREIGPLRFTFAGDDPAGHAALGRDADRGDQHAGVLGPACARTGALP